MARRIPRHDHRRGHRCPTCHLYSTPEGRRRAEAEFRARYGKKGGRKGRGYKYIYGATVGKVHREQMVLRGQVPGSDGRTYQYTAVVRPVRRRRSRR